jgi:integrase/recombinase XerD
MSSLTTKNIEIGFDGKDWIQMVRKKTNRKISVPVLPKAKEILEKFNSYLKEISVLLSIDKKLTHHILERLLQLLYCYLIMYPWKLYQSY